MKTQSPHLPSELKDLVHRSVALLGDIIRRETGSIQYRRIEKIRSVMAGLRESSDADKLTVLEKLLKELRRRPAHEHAQIATSFTLMLQLMNACENAYRTFRLSQEKSPPSSKNGPASITYVLTAHPTEARSSQSIDAFHEIQNILVRCLVEKTTPFSDQNENDLRHALEIAWRTPITRSRKPRVKDEAEHIYSLLLRDETLLCLLQLGRGSTTLGLRTWVGGDKDGHPGVDEKVMLESLCLSRKFLVDSGLLQARRLRKNLDLISEISLQKSMNQLEHELRSLRHLKTSDGARLQKLHLHFSLLKKIMSRPWAPFTRLFEDLKICCEVFRGL